jgi:hypothetical protein
MAIHPVTLINIYVSVSSPPHHTQPLLVRLLQFFNRSVSLYPITLLLPQNHTHSPTHPPDLTHSLSLIHPSINLSHFPSFFSTCLLSSFLSVTQRAVLGDGGLPLQFPCIGTSVSGEGSPHPPNPHHHPTVLCAVKGGDIKDARCVYT